MPRSQHLYYRNHSVIESKEPMNDDVGIISIRENNRVFNIDLESQSGRIRTLKTRTSSTTCGRAFLGSRVTQTEWSDWEIQEWDVDQSEDNLSIKIASYMTHYPSLHSNIQYMGVTKADLHAFENAFNQNIADIDHRKSYDPFEIFKQSIIDAGIQLPCEDSICVVS